jgi:hypothetical protein
MKRPRNIEFRKSPRKGKKYQVDFDYDGKHYIRHFGSSDHEHYKDVTGLGLYSKKNHLSKARRDNYYARHGEEDDPRSAKWWAHRYLWPKR